MSFIMTEGKFQKFIEMNLTLKAVVVKKYWALKLILNFIFDDHI